MSNPLTGNFPVVLDACVLWPNSLRDTLLRLAETPRLYTPQWTDTIWEEVLRNLTARRGLTSEQTDHLLSQVKEHFPEAFVTGYEPLIGLMSNDPKDRHVVAAAVRTNAQVIVTFNLKDFPPAALSEWGIEAQHPDDFLLYQYDLNPTVVISKLHEQAANIGRTLAALLNTLQKGVPEFADKVARKLELEIEGR
jgi:predicted nucleic acid-binding protein